MTADGVKSEQKLYKSVEQGAIQAGVFAQVAVDDRGLWCQAKDAAEPAYYFVSIADGDVWIGLETEDRWLSGSIEADLVNTGDKLDELIEEEVIDLGHVDAKVSFEHFRSPEKKYIFRSKLSTSLDDPRAAEHALIWLLGYELVLRELGDMSQTDDD